MNVFKYASAELVADAFASHLIAASKGKAPFHLALSGGSTPKILFDIISKKFADQFDWSNIHFWWGDERCVAPTDDDSNYKMTKERLIDHISISAENVHRVLGENAPEEEAKRYEQEIKQFVPEVNGLPKFDLIILGMGPDGHTASIFPHQIDLLKATNICEVASHPESGQRRITITGPTLNNAAEVAFLVTGSNKKEKINEIFNKTSNWELYPASFIDPKAGQLNWFMDDAAAEGI